MEKINNLNTNIEALKEKKESLIEAKDLMMDGFEDLFRKSRAVTGEEKDRLKEEMKNVYGEIISSKSYQDLNEELNKINTEIMLRLRKDLATNYLVTKSVIDDCYAKLFDLPEGDPLVREIESKIEELQVLLNQDIEKLNEEGVTEKRVESGNY